MKTCFQERNGLVILQNVFGFIGDFFPTKGLVNPGPGELLRVYIKSKAYQKP